MIKRYGLMSVMVLLGAFLLSAPPATAQEIWSGYDYYFEKADFADWTQEANQDRITDNVWITRANSQGIFNIVTEAGYIDFLSPGDTEWAMGTTDDWDTLNYLTWVEWAGFNPPGTVGQNAVVHLITDDIYIDIRFASWSSGGSGGGFSYDRGMPGSTPIEDSTWGRLKALY